MKNEYQKLINGVLKKLDLDFSSLIDTSINHLKESLDQLKEMDILLSEIKKVNSAITEQELNALQETSFQIANQYGTNATDYLSTVKTLTKSGYSHVEDLAQLSTALQTASGMTSDLATQFLIATDQAYEFGGSVKQLQMVLDGSSRIASSSSIPLSELTQGMMELHSISSSINIELSETTAALATLLSVTNQSSSEAAAALQDIFTTLQKLTDENPMEVLEHWANSSFSEVLPSSKLLNALEKENSSSAFTALLENWDTYQTLLDEYSYGNSSLAEEAETASRSWEASLNRLSNTWASTMNQFANSDTIVSLLDLLNSLLSIVNQLTNSLGSWGTLSTGISAILSAKNLGKLKESFYIHSISFV